MPIVLVAIWMALQPKDVGYDDVVTARNATTFASHHSWSDSFTEDGNTKAAQDGIARLGDKAYGKTFGAVMDLEKAHRQAVIDQTAHAKLAAWKQSCSPGSKYDEGDDLCDRKMTAPAAAKVMDTCWVVLRGYLDRIVADQHAVGSSLQASNAASASVAAQNENTQIQEAKTVVSSKRDSCPAAFNDLYDDASKYLDNQQDVVGVDNEVLAGHDISSDDLRAQMDQSDRLMLKIAVDKLVVGSRLGDKRPTQ